MFASRSCGDAVDGLSRLYVVHQSAFGHHDAAITDIQMIARAKTLQVSSYTKITASNSLEARAKAFGRGLAFLVAEF